jgi:hypothetical protein
MRVFFDKAHEIASPGSRVSFHAGQFYHIDDEALAAELISAGIGRPEEVVGLESSVVGQEEPKPVPAEDSPHDGA